jgi:hypothetical protein
MSLPIDKTKTELFTVVGAPYVHEEHSEGHNSLREHSDALPPEAGIATLWVVLYLAIFGVTLFANGSVSGAFSVAMAYLK